MLGNDGPCSLTIGSKRLEPGVVLFQNNAPGEAEGDLFVTLAELLVGLVQRAYNVDIQITVVLVQEVGHGETGVSMGRVMGSREREIIV